MMSLLRRLTSLTIIGLLVASGCHDETVSPTVSSETHFLSPCTDSCGGGLECICGVCTLGCSTNDDCPGLHPDAQCLPACDGASVSPVCDLPCTSDAECGALGSEGRCVGGRCRTSRPPLLADTAEEFCRTEVGLLAELFARCTGATVDNWRDLILRADFICGNASEAAQNGRLSFSQTDAQACVETMATALASADCGDDPGVPTVMSDAACTNALTGAVPLGGGCRSFHILEVFDECQGDAFCDQGGIESCMGTCTAYLDEGATCDTFDASLRCGSGLNCSHDTCMADAQLDAPCEGPDAARCGEGLYCEGGDSAQAGVCKAEKTSGACVDDSECATLHFCNANGTCERYHADGEACTPGDGECYPALSVCSAGKCTGTLPRLGEACGSIDGETVVCAEGYCNAASGEQGTCTSEKQPGEACAGNTECSGNNGHCDETSGLCVSCDAP